MLYARGPQRPGDLQAGGHIGAVVGGARRPGHGVVVGHHRHGRRRAVASGQHADDVLVVAALDIDRLGIDAVGDRLAGLDVGLQAHGLAAARQIVAHPVVLGRSRRVRLASDLPDVGVGAAGGELQRRGAQAQGRRGPRRRPGQDAGHDEATNKGCGSKHGRGCPPKRHFDKRIES